MNKTRPALEVDNDGDGVFTPDDCNDNDPLIFPGAPERCNGLDDDCDGRVDEGLPLAVFGEPSVLRPHGDTRTGACSTSIRASAMSCRR